MTKSIMQLTDDILGESISPDTETATVEELPVITDSDRNMLINESSVVPKGDPPAPSIYDNDEEREQHQAGGPSRQHPKPKKKKPTKASLPTDPAAEQGMSLSIRKPKKENASLYPRVTMKGESVRPGTMGLSRGTTGHSKPKKTMGTPPGFEKKEEKEEAEAGKQSLMRNPQQTVKPAKKENASLYPRITLKGESREVGGMGRPRHTDVEGNPISQAGKTTVQGAEKEAVKKRVADSEAKRKEARQAAMKARAESGEVEKTSARIQQGKEYGEKVKKDWAANPNNPANKPPRSSSQNASITRNEYETLLEALSILREVTGVGSIGVNMGGSANKAYDADAKPMGKDTPPIQGVDKAISKMSRKGTKKKATKKKATKKKSKKDKKIENASFNTFLSTIVNETCGK